MISKDEIYLEFQKRLQELGIEPTNSFDVLVSKDPAFGDFSSNIAMLFAKSMQTNPKELAAKIISGWNPEWQEKLEVAGPGFINIFLKKSDVKTVIDKVLSNLDYGKSSKLSGKEILVEFGQPNTHKAFHVGHLKSAISGLSVVKLKENLGAKVHPLNYFGDVGMQVAKCTWGYLHKQTPAEIDNWDSRKKMEYIDECYVFGAKEFKENPESEAEIRQINKDIYAKADNTNYNTYKLLREWSLEHQTEIWASLGIKFEREYPESEVYEDAIRIVKENIGKIFSESKGAIIFDGTKDKMTTWVFLTGEGNPTYSAKDLGLAMKKLSEYPNLYESYITTSVEQRDYFNVVIHVLSLLRPTINGVATKEVYKHLPFGWLLQNKKKFSSRMGGAVKGMDILDEAYRLAAEKISEVKDYTPAEKERISRFVALAGLKFLILSHEFHKDINYDPENFLNLEGFSGPYIQYSFARAMSILKKADVDYKAFTNYENVLQSEAEQDLLKHLANYPDVAESAGLNTKPHIVCNYLYELAQKFNSFYRENSVLNAEKQEDKKARLKLTAATAQVLKHGLNLLGIETIDQM